MRRVFFCLLLALVSACTQSEEAKQNLALKCQVRSCACVPTSLGWFVTAASTPVLWRQNGDAYCPEGQALRPSDYKNDFKKRYGG